MFRVRLLAAAVVLMMAPVVVCAQGNASGQLAPADEYFGHYAMSVLGIANVLRDADARFTDSTNGGSMIDGPLSFVSDALHAWERKYPNDPWIAKDLYALELVYLHAPASRGMTLAVQTQAWLAHDYPNSRYIQDSQLALDDARGSGTTVTDNQSSAWARFAAARAPLPSTPH